MFQIFSIKKSQTTLKDIIQTRKGSKQENVSIQQFMERTMRTGRNHGQEHRVGYFRKSNNEGT